MKIWAILYSHNQIVQQLTLEPIKSIPQTLEDWIPYLDEVCHAFDIPHPVVLSKHIQDMLQFSKMMFKPKDFLESFDFQSMTLELLSDKKK